MQEKVIAVGLILPAVSRNVVDEHLDEVPKEDEPVHSVERGEQTLPGVRALEHRVALPSSEVKIRDDERAHAQSTISTPRQSARAAAP